MGIGTSPATQSRKCTPSLYVAAASPPGSRAPRRTTRRCRRVAVAERLGQHPRAVAQGPEAERVGRGARRRRDRPGVATRRSAVEMVVPPGRSSRVHGRGRLAGPHDAAQPPGRFGRPDLPRASRPGRTWHRCACVRTREVLGEPGHPVVQPERRARRPTARPPRRWCGCRRRGSRPGHRPGRRPRRTRSRRTAGTAPAPPPASRRACCRQVAVRGMPWAPPDFAPSTASRPSAAARPRSGSRGPRSSRGPGRSRRVRQCPGVRARPDRRAGTAVPRSAVAPTTHPPSGAPRRGPHQRTLTGGHRERALLPRQSRRPGRVVTPARRQAPDDQRNAESRDDGPASPSRRRR